MSYFLSSLSFFLGGADLTASAFFGLFFPPIITSASSRMSAGLLSLLSTILPSLISLTGAAALRSSESFLS